MEIVVTTPHGDADIRVTNQRATTTLAELIVAATGQAAPAVVRVDGRTIEASRTLDRAGLQRGSVIATEATAPDAEPRTLATLAQIAGPGAGRRHPLGSGRHRLGPGRRVSAAELSSAPVEEPVVTIDVDTDGSVTLHPIDRHQLTLGGAPVDGAVPWNDDDVAVIDDRAFVIERGVAVDDRAVGSAATDPGPEGSIAFRRRPRPAGVSERRPAIDAVHDATTRGPGLWQRRPADSDAFVVPIGLRASGGPPDVLTVDLAANGVVSITGPRRASLARAIVLEATTLHGPADLDVVVATTPAGPEDWDWAKWLPHVHTTGRSAILRDSEDIAAWADATTEFTRSHPTRSHLTLFIVDDPDLWRRRGSPLDDLVANPPDHVRILTLSAAATDVPPTATVLLTDDADRRWRRVSTATDTAEHLLAALVESNVARRAAIAMAALDDQEAPGRPETSDVGPRTVRSIVGPTERPTDGALLDQVCTGAVIVGPEHETGRTAAVLAMRRCLARPCWLLDLLGSPWTAGLAGLDGRCDTDLDSGSVDADRLLARLRHHLAGGSTQEVIVLVDSDREAGARVLAAATELDAVTVLATTSSEPSDATVPVVRVERREGRRRATIDLGGVEHTVTLDDDPDTGELSVRALVAGRPLTALERRIEREATRHPDVFVEQCRHLVGEFAPRTSSRPPVLARPPLPAPLAVGSLFARYPGDGVPIGIVDDPADDHDALWWQPERGHLVAIGPGLDGLLGTATSGLVDRYGDDEVEIVDGSAVVVSDDADDADDATIALIERLDRAERTDREHGAVRVVVVDDLGALRRRSRQVAHRFDTAVANGRFTVVGLAATLDDAGAVADAAATTLLVASPGDRSGRCRLAADGRVVQLADPHVSSADAESNGSTP